MSAWDKRLEAFAKKSRMTNRGALCVALIVTRHAKTKGLPLNPDDLVTASNGQVLGLGKAAVQAILREHGITKVLAEEGGRTSRGSIGNMKVYVAFLNELAQKEKVDLDAIEQWWIGQVKKTFAEKPMVLHLNPQMSFRAAFRDLLKQAKSRQDRDTGTMFLGAVMQHLVGAKLELVLQHSIESHGAFVADSVTNRSGDFCFDDTVIHVTTSPAEALLRKCRSNLENGLRPIIITLYSKVPVAESLAADINIQDCIDIFDIEQFVASNIFELAHFSESKRKVTIAELVQHYNHLASCENLTGLLIQGVTDKGEIHA